MLYAILFSPESPGISGAAGILSLSHISFLFPRRIMLGRSAVFQSLFAEFVSSFEVVIVQENPAQPDHNYNNNITLDPP